MPLLASRDLTRNAADLYLARTDSPDQSRLVFESPASEWTPMPSPDGRWLAYVSDETDGWEVYVRPFLGMGQRTTVSRRGGSEPRRDRDSGRAFLPQRREHVGRDHH